MIRLGPIVLIAIGALLGLLAVMNGWLEEKKPMGPRSPYQLYETAATIADRWRDSELVGLCSMCGMDDAPIVRSWAGGNVCKWCAELANLTHHLETNAGKGFNNVKEYQQRMKAILPKPPGERGGGSR